MYGSSNGSWLTSKSSSNWWWTSWNNDVSTTGSGITSNYNAEDDKYWDVSWGNKWAWPMDFSKGWTDITKENAIFWENAKARQSQDATFLTNRNNSIAYSAQKAWVKDEKWIKKFLTQFSDFNNASAEEQANTIRAISERMWFTGTWWAWDTTGWTNWGNWANWGTNAWLEEISKNLKDINWDWIEDRAWFYYENWEYYKAYWYESWSKELQDQFDRLPDDKKKEVSNYWAEALQEYLR